MKKLVPTLACLLALPAPAQAEQKPVTVDNFVRAETDFYLQRRADDGYFGKIVPLRETIPIDNQPVVRGNRDTLYSYGVFDLLTPVTITMPDSGARFQSLRLINQDHYIIQNSYDAGSFTLTQEDVGTRYLYVAVRTLVDPDDPEDVKAAHEMQDRVTYEQADVGVLDLPDWNAEQRDALRKAILQMAPFVPDSLDMFGAEEDVDPVRHLIGTAGGWAGGPAWASYYINVTPERNDGETPYTLTVGQVPVDGFWSISVYNRDGYFQESEHGGYSLNNITADAGADGSVTVHFGGDPEAENFLSIMPGWNYTIRLYRAREEVLDGTWTFPEAAPAQ